ncbi:MAG: OmpA family protein [Bacteroidetes bacterium]|nr:OmpA family protein [Bacteroidota bacterium]
MHPRTLLISLIIFTALAAPSIGLGQIFKKKNKEDKLDQSQPLPQEIFEFKNVNKIPFYFNRGTYKKIYELDEQKSWVDLYDKLKTYVTNFGIQNFYKDTYLLWRFAKLTELFGEMEDAKRLYKLVLKHHRDDIDVKAIELYFDSLNQNDSDYYVPLDYYYELVEYRKEVDTLRPPRGVLLNMGSNINSNLSDYGPTLGLNNNMLLLTSKRNVVIRSLAEVENEDIFFSKYNDGVWDESEPLKEINTPFNEGSACLSRNGQILFFSRCKSPGSYGNCDLFVAQMQKDSTWGNIQNLGFNVNSIAWDSHPSLSHTEDTLYFASDRIGGFGLSDIYFTYRRGDGTWAPAQNAGPIINTRTNEVSPFFHPKFNTLYFSSNGHLLNFGEFDIYKSDRIGNIWDEPKNIGPLINGVGSEFYFTIDSDSRNLYYARSSGNNLKNLDLYSFPLPMEAQPGATTTLIGTLTDNVTEEPFQGIVSIIDLENGIEVAPKFLRPDGSYEFSLINNQNYLLIIQGDAFFRIEEIFFLEGDTELPKTTDHISSKMKFESIEFEVEKADLLPGMYGDLDKVINFLLDNPNFKIKISGHTDSHGTPEFNLDLSKRRAHAIREYLIYFGSIEESKVEADGFGDTQSIVEEHTKDDASLNRRVEFEIFRPAK